MGNLSKNFNEYEFACKCGKCDHDGSAISSELVAALELVRCHFTALAFGGDVRVTVNSGHRCPDWNRHVGGSPSSKHLLGIAADIVVEEKCGDEWREFRSSYVAEYLEKVFQNKYGIGRYDSFTHIDVRKERARW